MHLPYVRITLETITRKLSPFKKHPPIKEKTTREAWLNYIGET